MPDFSRLDDEIWGNDGRSLDIDYDAHIKALELVVSKLTNVASAIKGHSQSVEGGMKAVLNEVSSRMADGNKGLAEAKNELANVVEYNAKIADAIRSTNTESLTAALAEIKEQNKLNRQATSAVMQVIVDLSDRMAQLERALTAPRHIVRDNEGRPVGVRIGS